MQQAQSRGVRRADVHHQVVGNRSQRFGRDSVVSDGIAQVDRFGFADVHSDDRPQRRIASLKGSPRCGDARGYGSSAVVIEAHPVDDRPVLDQPEEAWLGVAGLGLSGDGSHLDMAESEVCKGSNAVPLLVETCGKTERRREGHTECCGLQFGSRPGDATQDVARRSPAGPPD